MMKFIPAPVALFFGSALAWVRGNLLSLVLVAVFLSGVWIRGKIDESTVLIAKNEQLKAEKAATKAREDLNTKVGEETEKRLAALKAAENNANARRRPYRAKHKNPAVPVGKPSPGRLQDLRDAAAAANKAAR